MASGRKARGLRSNRKSGGEAGIRGGRNVLRPYKRGGKTHRDVELRLLVEGGQKFLEGGAVLGGGD